MKSQFICKNLTSKLHSKDNINKFRKLMKLNNYDAFILTNSDSHKNEYLTEKDKKIKNLSNFTGSSALALVTQDKALLWTDSRYYLQAEKELDEGWSMIPIENSEKDLKNFLKQNLSGKNVYVDYKNFSVNYLLSLKDYLHKNNIKLNDDQKLSDEIVLENEFRENVNEFDKNVFIHELKYSGMSTLEKFKLVKETFINKNKTENINNINLNEELTIAIVINKLDDLAWLTNLRGFDIQNNPVFFSYGILYLNLKNDEAKLDLFTDESKFKNITKSYLNENNLEIKGYNDFYDEFNNRENNIKKDIKNLTFIIDKNSSNYLIYEKIIHSGCKYSIIDYNPIEYTKCIKNKTELEGIRKAHRRDGAAIVRYLAWLENELLVKNNKVSEFEGTNKLLQFRKENELFIMESFPTISSSGANSAIIHYKPEKEKCELINPNEIYLLDSGGQYLDGTTDTTRTVHFAEPTEYQKEMYTRVLLGNLHVERILFKNKSGGQIDGIARQFLWAIGEDYGHGTGHGVGHFLNVHEGPQSISPRSNVIFKHGMVTSNEPGFYKNDKFGIRIENVLLCLENNEKENLLFFENATRVHYDINLINSRLLSRDIIDYINLYHQKVYHSLNDILLNDKLALDYLNRKTRLI